MKPTLRPAPTSHSYFSQRLRLHYVDWGNRDATNLLLVHGIQDHCRTWDWLATALAPRYHVVAPDLRGHGDSEWVRGSGYHQLDYTYDLAQLVRQADLAPAVMVGHSMGGTLASVYAGVYPENVSKLVLIEAIGLWERLLLNMPPHERVRGWISEMRDLAGRIPRRYGSVEEAHERMQAVNTYLRPEQAQHLTVHGSNQNEDGSYSWKFDNYTHAFSPVGALPKQDLAALWGRIRCPVLIINGENGFEHRIGHDGTLDHFQRAELITVPDAGHWVHHDRLDAVTAALLDFLGT